MEKEQPVSAGRDELDLFLDTWEPSELSHYVALDSNLYDPVAEARLMADQSAVGRVQRTPFVLGTKLMTEHEEQLRKFSYFKTNQESWSEDFRTRLIDNGLDEEKVDAFIRSFATIWIDGSNRRQSSPEMLAIKASIRDHDRFFDSAHAGKYVLTTIAEDVEPLFSPIEMRAIFQVNCDLIEVYIQHYIAELYGERDGSINHIYVRRGVHMPMNPGAFREELHYLSSYSFALTPVEQFSQTYTKSTHEAGIPCIFSAPLPALQKRVVAFSGFIKEMDLRQLELVVAPPVEPTTMASAGEWGGIREYQFA